MLSGRSINLQFFVYKKKGAPINQCAGPGCRILGVADRLDLEFRWPSGPNSRSKGAPLAAWAGFTLPSALMMFAFVLLAPHLEGPTTDAVL